MITKIFLFKFMDLRVGKNYQLIKKIGSGAFGEIYEGKFIF